MEEEEKFLRRNIVRLRGAMRFANAPDVQAILREFITDAEDRLDALEEQKRGPRKR